jgi:hypothetical protein
MLYRSTIITQASGSLNGKVFSHNRGGDYIRRRTTPIDPMTAEQTACRTAFSAISNRWVAKLNSTRRLAWEAYAAANPCPNRLGEPKNVGGRAMFARVNFYQAQATAWLGSAASWYDDPPPNGRITPDDTQWVRSGTTLTYTLNHNDDWYNESGGRLYVYCSEPLKPTVRSIVHPCTLLGVVAAGASDATFTGLTTLPSGWHCTVKTVATWPNGQPSQKRMVAVPRVF